MADLTTLFNSFYLFFTECMTLRPLGDRVIVKPVAKEDKTQGGIILPDTKEERADHGEVIAVGPGKLLENGTRSTMNVNIGDKVMFKKYAPDEFKVDGDTLLVLSESDLIAVVE